MLGLTAAATPARADHLSAQATVLANVALTNNVFDAPSGGEADLFVQVRPGVLLAYESPRMLQELTADVEALEFVRNSDQPSINYHAGYHARFTPSTRSTINLGANGTTGQLSQLSAQTTPDQTGAQALPPGRVAVRAADVSQSASYEVSPELRLQQNAFGRFADTNDQVSLDVTSYEAGASLGTEYPWRGNAVAIEAGVAIAHLQRLGPVGGPSGVDRLDRQLNPHITASWRHDFTKKWSGLANGGVVMINPYGTDPFNPTDVRTRQYFPVFATTAAYTDDWGRATLSAGRAIQPNLFIAQNTVADTLTASAVVPLWFTGGRRQAPQYVGAASLGYARTQLTDQVSSDALGVTNVYHADVGFTYAPTPGLAYGVRYEYFYQTASASAAALFGSYARQTLFVTFAYRWPARLAVDVPKRRTSLRADGRDSDPVGGEQVVPDDSGGGDDQRGGGTGGNQGGPGTGGVSGSTTGTSGTTGGASGTTGGASGTSGD